MWGGANIGGNVGAALGEGKTIDGYRDARELMQKLSAEAQTTQDKIDPFNKFRSGYATQLDDILQGRRGIETDPGYQFNLQEGTNQVNRAAAAKGYGQSGNVLAALQARGADIASQQYGSIIDRLTNLAGAGSGNAIAGGQAYGSMMQAGLTGQADAEIGIGAAGGRRMADWGNAVHGVAQVVGSVFGQGMTGGSEGAAPTTGGGGTSGGGGGGGGGAGFNIGSFFGG